MAAKKTSSKSDFIRSQPADLSAAEVVAKAKGAGLKFSRQLVSAVRARAKAKGKAPASKKAPAAKSAAPAATTAGKTTSKAAFVRAHASLSPKEIIAKAKAQGIKLGVSYVYNVRGADKMAAKKKRGGKLSAAVATSPALQGHGPSSSVEALLKAVGAELGLAVAIALLHEERARVRAAIGG
jgi:hypothetical protein